MIRDLHLFEKNVYIHQLEFEKDEALLWYYYSDMGVLLALIWHVSILLFLLMRVQILCSDIKSIYILKPNVRHSSSPIDADIVHVLVNIRLWSAGYLLVWCVCVWDQCWETSLLCNGRLAVVEYMSASTPFPLPMQHEFIVLPWVH